ATPDRRCPRLRRNPVESPGPSRRTIMDNQPMNRREFVTLAAAGLAAASTGQAFAQKAEPTPRLDGGIAWYDVREWGVEGKGWSETARFFDRLPAKAEGVVPAPVWNLSRQAAGM